MSKYNPQNIEKKWQDKWADAKLYEHKEEADKEKYYILDMFPYPSGDGLHMGHTESYTASDIIYRYKKLQGYDVLHPQGFDSFGLPAENYAIKTGVHPAITTEKNASNYIEQMKMLGLGHDMSALAYTSRPDYYKWTQFLFGKFFENNLVVRKTDTINWCPSCNTGIANEQVEDGACERCKAVIEKRNIPGWFFKITDFADELIDDLDTVDWPEHTVKNQRNWIGKSEGANIKFKVESDIKKKTAVLIHGWGGSGDEGWFKEAKANLEAKGYQVVSPDFPGPNNPVYSDWKDYFSEFVAPMLTEDSLMIGHSLGPSFFMRYVSETKLRIANAFFVAPVLDNQIGELDNFFENDFNFEKIKEAIGNITVIGSDNDRFIPQKDFEKLSELLGVELNLGEGREHFYQNEESNPELIAKLDELVMSDSGDSLEVFTTRPDTLFGATYMVVAPEHCLITNYELAITNYKEVDEYIKKAKNKTELERMENKEKTGIEIKGVRAINPATSEEIPVFVADYVLGGYGTGAIMAVPAHDERDFEFAEKFGLEIREVVAPYMKKDYDETKEVEERDVVVTIVKDVKNGKFLCLNWSQTNWKSFPTGGTDGEDLEVAAKREILEETGYKNIKFIKKIGGPIYADFYRPHKGSNVKAHFNYVYFELIDHEQIEVDQKEKDLHRLEWVEESKISDFLNIWNQQIAWKRLRGELKTYSEAGKAINSEFLNGLLTEDAKIQMIEWLEEKGIGEGTSTYRLRDWSMSRQRYWGCPIPIVYSPEGVAQFVGEENLPWTLPEDVDFVPTGESPLKLSKELFARTEKLFGKGWTPEVDTMDTFVDSSWYFLRYPDAHNTGEFCSKELLKRWSPVDMYIGGAEHTYMHLLYARFFVKAMNKMGLIDFNEPFLKLRHQGMVLDNLGKKMSKSKGNVINPETMVEKFGADATRLYMMFVGPLEDDVMFNEDGVKGVYRFLEKVWRVYTEKNLIDCGGDCAEIDKSIPPLFHKTIKKVSEDIETMSFNTAISQMMIFVNECLKQDKLPKTAMEKFVVLLSPFAPHITDEIWENLGKDNLIIKESWPAYNESMIKDENIKLVVQVNGKVRDTLEVSADISEENAKQQAIDSEKVKVWIEGKEVRKVIYVPGKLVSIVV